MVEIHHYVNLVGWEEIYDELTPKCSRNTHYYNCDSMSFWWLALMFGFSLKLRPGVEAYHNFKLKEDENEVVLLGNKGAIFETIQLPDLITVSDIDDYTHELVLPRNRKFVLLGISSPKQNRMASKIADKDGVTEIYCFGAAVYEDVSVNTSGLYFLRFLLKRPKRTIRKLFITLVEVFAIVFTKRRKKFLEFLKHFEH